VIKHQNIIGWDLFLKGYISSYWTHAIFDLKDISEVHFSDNWDAKNVELAITLYRGLWDNRNRHIYGGTKCLRLVRSSGHSTTYATHTSSGTRRPWSDINL
jgi:hypothetical protein